MGAEEPCGFLPYFSRFASDSSSSFYQNPRPLHEELGFPRMSRLAHLMIPEEVPPPYDGARYT